MEGLVELKNGTKEMKSLVQTLIGLVLPLLMEEDPISFCELVMKCRDKNHKIFSKDQEKKLQDLNLLGPGGVIRNSIVNIIVSAVEGDGLQIKLGSPLAE